MSQNAPKPVVGLIFILALHLPFTLYAWQLAGEMAPEQTITTLPAGSLLILLALLLLPYPVLKHLRVKWNPDRARLNEPID